MCRQKRLSSRTTLKLASAILSTLMLLTSTSTTAIQVDKDGGYTDIVVKISSSVPEDSCPKILTNIKVKQQNLIARKHYSG